MSLRPGGGLTVLLGILNGLHLAMSNATEITVLCSADGTKDGVLEQGIAAVKQPLANAAGIKRQLWVSTRMGKYVSELSSSSEDGVVFLSINQFVPWIRCPQVVYHINLLRFMPIDKTASFKERTFDWLRNYSAKQALKHSSANVYESEYIRVCAEKIYDSANPKDCVIYIGLPDNLANAAPESETTKTTWNEGQILAITNGNPHKDNGTLVSTVAELVKRKPDVKWCLKIAGGLFPELWAPYKKQAESLGALESIEWIGFQNQDQLTDHLKDSLCLVATSRVESFCMVALEAMGRGCPAIVANCAAMPESVGEAGVLAEPGDYVGFADAVIKFHEDAQLRQTYVDRGYEHVKTFRWDVCGQQFADLFQSITA